MEETDSETALNIPVQFRGHELNQIEEFVGDVVNEMQQAGVSGADELERVFDSHISTVPRDERHNSRFAQYISMPADDWHTVNRALTRYRRNHSGLRAWWLQNKLVDRLNDRITEVAE